MTEIYVPKSIDFYAKRIVVSTWIDHIHFAYDLVSALRPKLVVELGTYSGLSYFTFCQAMIENEIDGVTYGIDTWLGDEHAGEAGDSMYQKVGNYSRKHYRGISNLLRTTFAEAAPQFAEGSIDLLHIDGLHTYDAVKEDFTTWLPKMSAGGIILMHDINARLPGYGVWKLWEELESQFQTFSFKHGYGLGVLKVGESTESLTELEAILFNGSEKSHNDLRKLYVHIGKFHEQQRRVETLEAKLLR